MVHIIGDGDRLRTGMTPQDAAQAAKLWWHKVGSEHFRRVRSRKEDGIRGDGEIMYSSGILTGRRWDKLTPLEQFHIVKMHQNELYRAQMLGAGRN